jgi:hypothetical protein
MKPGLLDLNQQYGGPTFENLALVNATVNDWV